MPKAPVAQREPRSPGVGAPRGSRRSPDQAAAAPRFERQLPEERRRALIVATIDCLKAHGHEGMSVRRISAAAGVSIGLINHHFPNKDELVAQAYRHFNGELVAGLRRAVDAERLRSGAAADGGRQRLSVFFRNSFRAPNLDRDVLTAWIVFWGLLRHSPQIQRVHSEAYGGYLDLVKTMLTELEKDRGPFSLPCHLAAVGLTALLDGLWLEWCLDPGTFRPDQAIMLCERWVDALHAYRAHHP